MSSVSELRQVLRAIGLAPRQASIYLVGLKLGPAVVSQFASTLTVNRQQMYAELERLVQEGVMEATGIRPRRYFAVSPEQLLRREEEKQRSQEQVIQTISAALPLFRDYASIAEGALPLMTSYQGLERIRRGYERELVEAKGHEICSIVGSLEENYALLPETYWAEWNTQFAKQKSSCRMLVHASEAAKQAQAEDRIYKRQTRVLDQFAADMNIDIFGRHVLLVSCKERTALWIESVSIASSYRILFEALWRSAR
jgi:sugar-specific transcriptional regulator TrmB